MTFQREHHTAIRYKPIGVIQSFSILIVSPKMNSEEVSIELFRMAYFHITILPIDVLFFSREKRMR